MIGLMTSDPHDSCAEEPGISLMVETQDTSEERLKMKVESFVEKVKSQDWCLAVLQLQVCCRMGFTSHLPSEAAV